MKYKINILKYENKLMIEAIDKISGFPTLYFTINTINGTYQFDIFSKNEERTVINYLIDNNYIELLETKNDYHSYFKKGDKCIYNKRYTFSLSSKALLEFL